MNIDFKLMNDRIYNDEKFFYMMIEEQLIDLFNRISKISFEECTFYYRIPRPIFRSIDLTPNSYLGKIALGLEIPHEFLDVDARENRYSGITFNIGKLLRQVSIFKIENNINFKINSNNLEFKPIYEEIGNKIMGGRYNYISRKLNYEKDSNGDNIWRLPNYHLFKYKFGKYEMNFFIYTGTIDEHLDVLDYITVTVRDISFDYGSKDILNNRKDFITYIFEWRTFDNIHNFYKINGTMQEMNVDDNYMEVKGVPYNNKEFPFYEKV